MIHTFHSPSTPAQAAELMEQAQNARYLAGGTELNSMACQKKPEQVISLSGLGLNKISSQGENLVIGAMVTMESLLKTSLQAPAMKLLARACSNVGNRNIRNMATMGGNIAACKSCSDLLPPLLVLNARLRVFGAGAAEKTVSVDEYIRGDRNELILDITIPATSDLFRWGLCRYTRTANDLALVSICAGLEMKGSVCQSAAIAIGGVASTPVRVPEVEKLLAGQDLSEDIDAICSRADQALAGNIKPITDHRGNADYKMTLAKGLLREAVIHASIQGGSAQ